MQACPADALSFGLEEEMSVEARKRADGVEESFYGDKEAGGTRLLYVLHEKRESYRVRPIGPEKYPKHKIPRSVMVKDLFTLRCGLKGKMRALYLAIIHPKRLLYRYWR